MCTSGMRSDGDRSGAERTFQAHLGDLEHHCSELGIAIEPCGKILLQQQEDGLTATGVSRLLVQLSKPLSVLILSSGPRNTTQLRLAEERRELEDALQRTRFRASLDLHEVASCRVRDITSALDRYSPNILHFSGHGNNSALIFGNNRGEARAVEKAALASLLSTHWTLKHAILNACYSEDRAQAIAVAVGYVIEMENQDSADLFRDFYTALGHGRTFEDAFSRAKAVVGLTSTSFDANFLRDLCEVAIQNGANQGAHPGSVY
ncbi:hypothetical protein EJ08DRAFT_705627 [Tothia fuscella]|uniref:CHAT domain-containing protein n=1 Tax=Tothia fuscella TaxID=1048955 RepID=A0A9P4TTN3_9PEZI|nr:hypothetical protein EJ08DRAFT_705627 [Tothia fuscella]